MQRIISLGLLAVLLGGGWSVFNGVSTDGLRRVAQVVGTNFRGATQGATQLYGQSGFAPPTNYHSPQPGYAPVQGGPPPSYANPAVMGPAGYQPGQTAPTIRIASYNIEIFGNAKARKPYVMRTLAQIIRQFDIVAVQEIRTQDDYFIHKFLRDYVNVDGKALYDARVSKRLGRTTSTEQYAYIFNTATINIHPQVVFEVADQSDALHREPYVAMFQAKGVPPEQAFTFLLMNTHTDPDDVPQELDALYGAYQAVQRMPIGGQTEDDVILLGDLNTKVPASGPHTPGSPSRPLAPTDLRLLASLPGVYPLVRNTATNTAGTRLHDNLLISRIATTEYTGRSGVLDVPGQFGLSRDNAEQVSDHLPVWGEFSAAESRVLGRVASAH